MKTLRLKAWAVCTPRGRIRWNSVPQPLVYGKKASATLIAEGLFPKKCVVEPALVTITAAKRAKRGKR